MSAVELDVIRTNDGANVVVSMRDEKRSMGQLLTPAQARAVGASVTARANECDPAGAESSCLFCGKPVERKGPNAAWVQQRRYAGTVDGRTVDERGEIRVCHRVCGLPPSLGGEEPVLVNLASSVAADRDAEPEARRAARAVLEKAKAAP